MIAAILALLVSSAHAAPLDDYVCMKLAVTEAQVLDPKGTGIFIQTAPDALAPHALTAPGIVFVKKPEIRNNGFLAVMRLDGQTGWIAADKVVPMDPNYRCVPSEWKGH